MTQNVNAIARKVQVWVFHCGQKSTEVLIFKTNQKRGGFWQSVTGKVEDGESFETAAAREFKEETGISNNSPVKSAHFSFEFDSRFGRAIEKVFFVECAKQNPTLDPNEHETFEWVSVSEARARMKFDSSREALDRALEAMKS